MKNIVDRISALPADKQTALLQRLKQHTRPVDDAPFVQTRSDTWIVRYRPNEQARLRLFCIPYAGGSASIFRSWLDDLPPDIELCGIQLPGRETRLSEPASTHITPLIQEIAEAILPLLDRPFAFYGHSMGALICFELTRQLTRIYNKQPLCLYLAAYRAPQLPNPNIKIYHLPAEVFKVVLRADGIPERILQNEELMRAMLPTLRADFELCDTYEYSKEAPLSCPLVIFGGREDVRVRQEDLEAWSVHCNATCNLFMLPGSHFFLHSAQDQLLSIISHDLEARLNSL